MGEILQVLQNFKVGAPGWIFMWLLLVTFGFMLAIAIERGYYVLFRSSIDAPRFMADIRRLVANKEYERAVRLCEPLQKKPLPYVVLAALRTVLEKGNVDFRTIQNAVDEGTLEIIPRLHQRTSYLAMIGNIATLLGLMGTIYGLIMAFSSVSRPGIDPAQKAQMLAGGISTAMNTTLTGLAIAVPAILAYTVIHNKTLQIIDEIDEHTVKLINLITSEVE